MIPTLERYYNISHLVVSVIFFAPVVGYVAAAALSDKWHMWFGRRGVAFFAPLCRILGFVTLSQHPPYGVLVVVLILGGFGNGLLDASGNSWVSQLDHPNELLGVLHGFWGLGATVAPTLATAMITTYQLPWYTYYYVMIGLGATELVSITMAFWKDDAVEFRRHNIGPTHEAGRTRAALKQTPTWLVAGFLLIYVGVEGSSRYSASRKGSLINLSLPGRLARYLHASRAGRPGLCSWNDGNRLLARHHRRTHRPWIHHSTYRRTMGYFGVSHRLQGS